METPWYYEVPAWVNAGLLLGILLLAVEAGFRVGLKHFRSSTDERLKARGDVTLTAMLALLGLVLAFTYAFSLSRADLRKQAIVEEANAIGTAFLRADLAAEPGRTELRRLLLDYAQTRILGPEMRGTHEQTVAVIARSEEALAALWPATKGVVLIGNPDPFKASIFQAINETIDA